MSKDKDKDNDNGTEPATIESRSLPIAQKGISTDGDFAAMMSAIMSDVIEGKITPATANAAVNAGGKLLKVVEMRMKYGTRGDDQKKRLPLVDEAAVQQFVEN